MLYFYSIIFLLVLFGFRRREIGDVWLSKQDTTVINGIFILTVFVCHCGAYLPSLGADVDQWWMMKTQRLFNRLIGQVQVAPFLFFSGYGVMLQCYTKGENYINGIPLKRIFVTLINFDVAVLLYAILHVGLGHEISVWQSVLSVIAWRSFGNSNWYIFVILWCYLFVYLANKMMKTRKLIILSVVLQVGLFAFVMAISRGYWWWSTILAFVAGCAFALYRTSFLRLMEAHWRTIFIFGVITYGLLTYLCGHVGGVVFNSIVFNFRSVSFVVVISAFLYKFKIRSKALYWAGVSLFPLYIYQRIPMIIMTERLSDYVIACPVLYMVISFAVSICLVFMYKFVKVRL